MDENIKNEFNENEKQQTMEIPVLQDEVSISEDQSSLADINEDKFFQSTDKKGKMWIPIFISSILVVVTCFTLLTSYVFKLMDENGWFKGMAKMITPIMGQAEPPKNTNVLLVGTDKGGYRTDTIMIATYNNENEAISVMQIPRDTYVGNNGRRDKKVNSAYFTGIDQLKLEVELSYGIKVHRYLAVELSGFVQMVDKLGGVEIEVPINMNYDDPEQDLHIHLKKGYQLLDGKKSEQFVRFRKNNDGTGYPLGDIGRMESQKNFIMAMIKKVISMDGIGKIPDLISIAQQNIKTDVAYDEAYGYMSKLLTIDEDKILFMDAPGEMEYRNGWYFFVDTKKSHEMAVEYFYADKNKSIPTTKLPPSKPKSEPVYDPNKDVHEDERYTYYKKTPEPEKSEKPYEDVTLSTPRPTPAVTGESLTETKPSPTATAMPKPTSTPVNTAKPEETPAQATPDLADDEDIVEDNDD